MLGALCSTSGLLVPNPGPAIVVPSARNGQSHSHTVPQRIAADKFFHTTGLIAESNLFGIPPAAAKAPAVQSFLDEKAEKNDELSQTLQELLDEKAALMKQLEGKKPSIPIEELPPAPQVLQDLLDEKAALLKQLEAAKAAE